MAFRKRAWAWAAAVRATAYRNSLPQDYWQASSASAAMVAAANRKAIGKRAKRAQPFLTLGAAPVFGLADHSLCAAIGSLSHQLVGQMVA